MRKFIGFLPFILLLSTMAIIFSCNEETYTEEDAFNAQTDLELLRDSLRKVGGVINYAVSVVPANDAGFVQNTIERKKSATDFKDAVVTVSQNGVRLTQTTDESGIVVFKDLRIGTVNVSIVKTGFTSVEFVAELPPIRDTVAGKPYEVLRSVGTLVPIFSTTDNLATITGIATIETNLVNTAPELAEGIEVIGIIDVTDPAFTKYFYNKTFFFNGVQFTYYGKIMHIAYQSLVSRAKTDANGAYTLKVPSTADGLPIKVLVSEFAANQTLLMATKNKEMVWGEQTVRTLYGHFDTDNGLAFNYSPVDVTIPGAYVQIDAPTGTGYAQPTRDASFTAVLTNSGIASVNITAPGEGYTQVPRVIIPSGTGFNSVQAEGTAVMSNGRITSVTIDKAGSGYKPTDITNVSFVEGIDRQASAYAEMSFSISKININSSGSGYSQTAPGVTISGSGTGATAHAEMYAFINKLNVILPGSGYTAVPQITIADNFGGLATANAVMTTENPIASIEYRGTNNAHWAASPLPTVTIVGNNGSGATANLTLDQTNGKIIGITLTNGGAGYTAVPTIQFTGGNGFGATATATIGGGAVTSINIVDGGQGYTSVPSISILGGGNIANVATATAQIGFPVKSITLNQPGTGYQNVTAIRVSDGNVNVNYVNNCKVSFNMGIRSVTLSDGGYFFKSTPIISINPIDGNGSGASITAELNWQIQSIVVDNHGSGYKQDDKNDIYVKIDPPTGTGGAQATASAELNNGVVTGIKLIDWGEGYTASPNVYFRNTGIAPYKQAKLSADVSGGHISGINILDAGEGYDYNSYMNGDYFIEISTFNTAASASAKANPNSGQIAFINITDPGEGYVVAPTIEFQPTNSLANGFGSGAVATANIVDGKVVSVNLSNGGSGYFAVPVVKAIVPNYPLRAVGKCVVNALGFIQSVDFNAGPGYTKGAGYLATPTVTFFPAVNGKGSGATGVAIIRNGMVDQIVMTNQGSGYVGKNIAKQDFSFVPTGTAGTTFNVFGAKTYMRDINLGTGKRTIED